MDVLARFPRVWCPTCNKTQPVIFDVMKANNKNDHDAADIVCNECKSVIATLDGPSAHRAGVRTDRAEKARAMAGQEITLGRQTTKASRSAAPEDLVRSVAVPAAPVPHARATLIKCRK
jgi:ribosomal protein S27E